MVRRAAAAISVYTALSLFLIIVLITVFAEHARLQGAYAYVQYSMAAATDTLFGNYCKELEEQYDLLFFDGGYGSGGLQLREMEAEWETYFQIYQNGREGLHLFPFTEQSAQFNELKTAVDDNGSYFVDSVYEYMKYVEIGEIISVISSACPAISEAIGVWNGIQEETEEIRAELQDTEQTATRRKSGAPASGENAPALRFDELDKYDIGETMGSGEWKSLTAFLIYPGIWNFSGEAFEMTDAPSAFLNTAGTSDIQNRFAAFGECTQEELGEAYMNSIKKLCLIQYDFQKFSCYTAASQEAEAGERLDYELEYILIGSQNEYDNFSDIINLIHMLRTACNCVHILADTEKMETLQNAAELIAGASANPIIIELAKYTLLYLWAYTEAVLDVRALLKGEEMGLIKADGEWVTDLDGIVQAVEERSITGIFTALFQQNAAESENGGETAAGNDNNTIMQFGYEDYLFFLFLLQDEDVLAYRSMDVIQIHMQETCSGFSMRNMVYAVEIETEVKFEGVFITEESYTKLYESDILSAPSRRFYDYRTY